MILKLTLFFLLVVTDIHGGPVNNNYIHSNAAGGWLAYYKDATWSDAEAHCAVEDGVIASPVTSQIRDAINNFVKEHVKQHDVSWIMTGVRADMEKGDFFSGEGVLLSDMPVIYNFNASGNSNECVKWKAGSTEVQSVDCNTKLDYVCFKKRETVAVVGCGTRDLDYKYDARSGSCYKLHQNQMSWSRAVMKCKKEGASLAVINNELEKLVFKEMQTHMVWVGIRDWNEDGKSWLTVQGQTLSEAGFDSWVEGEPSYADTMHCVASNLGGNYTNRCCSGLMNFICEKMPELLTHTIQSFLYKIVS